jgi:hypothetical protein
MGLCAQLSLSLWYCMNDIVCMQNYDIIPLVMFCEVLYINIHIGHAKIFINLPPGDQVCLTGLPKKPSGNRSLPIGKPFQTDCTGLLIWFFEFVRFLAVTAAYRPVYQNRRPAVRGSGSVRLTLTRASRVHVQ